LLTAIISMRMKTCSTHNPAAVWPSGSSAPKHRPGPGWLAMLILALFAGITGASAQQSNLSCALTNAQIIPPTYTGLSVATSVTGGGAWGGFLNGNPESNAIDANTTNYAEGNITLSGSVSLRVNSTVPYAVGNYAGFVFGMSGLNINALSGVTLRTYLGTTLQETVSSATLLGINLGGGLTQAGFYTDKPYDGIEITYASSVSLSSSFNVYYAVMRGTGSCTVTATPPCNAPVHPLFSNYRMVVDPTRIGVTGVTTNTWTGLGNLVDADTTNAASLSIPVSVSLLSTATLGLKRTVGDFPAGYFAGFDIENRGLLGLGLLSNLTVNAYRNDTLIGTATGTNLLLGASVLGNSGRQTVGFVTAEAFDEVELVMAQPVNVNIGTTSVYGAVIRNFCAGPALPCNTPVAQRESTYPVYINTQRTGFTGAACPLCRIDSVGNMLDNDTLNVTTIAMTAGALTTGSISVRNAVTTYPAKTYAGFEIANPSLANLSALPNVAVNIYRAGVLKQSFSGNGLLVSLPSSLISAAGRYNIGFLADSTFDEVQLSITQTVGVDLGTTIVYTHLIEGFCPGTLVCRSTNWLNAPAQSVFIDQRQTGLTGTACALCAVNNPNNAITPSTTDFAQLVTTASVISSTSLAVKDATTTYPAGSLAGFAVQDPNNVLQLNLLRTIEISTWNKDTLVERRTGGQLLNLSLLILQLNGTTGNYNLGFQTTRPFDEIKISLTPLAGVAATLNVLGAYVDTRNVDTISSTQICAAAPVADPDNLGTPRNVAVTGNLKTNDRDPGKLPLTYSGTPATPAKHGTLTINNDGTFTYTPATGYVGADSFAYTVCNTQAQCSIGWAYISVLDSLKANAPNRPQVLQPDESQTLMGVPVSGNAAANDVDVEQRPINYAVTTNPLHGTLVLTPSGQYIYTPDSSYVGRDSALITACDTATPQICRSSVVRFVVWPWTDGNHRPYAEDDVVAVRSGITTTNNVLTNDKDPDNDALTAAPIGTVASTSGVFSMSPNGFWTFTPAPGFVGTVFVPYVVSDGKGGTDTATLSIVSLPYLGPDYTPTIMINSPNFPTVGAVRDFRVDISELRNSLNDGLLTFRLFKPSAFTIIASDTITSVTVNGTGSPSTVTNANWTFTETATGILCTLKPGVALAGLNIHSLGFRLQRKSNIPTNTTQNLTISIAAGSGGDAQTNNNQYSVSVTAQ
jgi:hypothetical protein